MPRRKPFHRPPSQSRCPAGKAVTINLKKSEEWLCGRHPVMAALRNPARRCLRLYATEQGIDDVTPILKLRYEREKALEINVVSRASLDAALPAGTPHQDLILQVIPLPTPHIENILEMSAAMAAAVVIALDQVTNPHNVGAVLRSAAAFGAVAVVTQNRYAPQEARMLAKASSGALEQVPLVRVTNLAQALERFKGGGFWVVGMCADGATTLATADLSEPLVLVLGSEDTGLRRLTRERCDVLARLPMAPGAVESLNISNAAAVALYEVRRKALEGSL